jgi:hypothetical protein
VDLGSGNSNLLLQSANEFILNLLTRSLQTILMITLFPVFIGISADDLLEHGERLILDVAGCIQHIDGNSLGSLEGVYNNAGNVEWVSVEVQNLDVREIDRGFLFGDTTQLATPTVLEVAARLGIQVGIFTAYTNRME